MLTISTECEKIMHIKFARYDQVAKSFQKFFDQDELERRIERKADIVFVRDSDEQKADITNLD